MFDLWNLFTEVCPLQKEDILFIQRPKNTQCSRCTSTKGGSCSNSSETTCGQQYHFDWSLHVEHNNRFWGNWRLCFPRMTFGSSVGVWTETDLSLDILNEQRSCSIILPKIPRPETLDGKFPSRLSFTSCWERLSGSYCRWKTQRWEVKGGQEKPQGMKSKTETLMAERDTQTGRLTHQRGTWRMQRLREEMKAQKLQTIQQHIAKTVHC